jgi:ankyrin repeat protein
MLSWIRSLYTRILEAICPDPSQLYVAAQQGQMAAMVQYLVQQGADKDRACFSNKTPLCIAAYKGRLAIVQYLVQQGADKDKATNNGCTPLFVAAQKGRMEVVQYLVQQGADKDKAIDCGYTPLHVAVMGGQLEVVEYLLEQGADRDKQDSFGDTPLHMAAMHVHLEVTKALMRYGANLDARNEYEEGQLPIDVARSEEVRQAILDEPRRRNDHTYKRIREEDLQPAKQQEAEVGGRGSRRIGRRFRR